MKQVLDSNVARLRYEELFGLLKKVLNSGRAMLPEEAKSILDAFELAVNNYDAKLELSRKNSFTEKQTLADEEFDAVYTHAFEYARVMPYFPVPAGAEAGAKILAIFEKYGKITVLGFTEEYAKGHNLLQDIEALGEAALTAANFTPWLDNLKLKHAQFSVLRESKQAEDTATITGAAKEARKAAEEAYRTFIQKINAMCVVMGEEHYGAFIDQVNTYVEEMKTILKARTTRNANAKAKEESAESGGQESTDNGQESTEA